MSVQAISWALRQRLPGIPKSVLFVLANYADEDGECFPGQKRLAADTGWSERTVRNAIKHLETIGLLAIVIRRRKDGSWTSSRYHLAVNQRHVVPTAQRAGTSGTSCRPIKRQNTRKPLQSKKAEVVGLEEERF